LEESKRMESLEQVPTNCGYIYVNDDGIDMIEYHIDVSYHFEDKLAGCPFGGNLSIRKPIAAKPVIYVGQDEAIFKQFLFSHKMWVAPGGQQALLPKDEGSGIMVSAFVTREHGIIREISNMVLDEVNEQRLGQVYADEEAANEVHGCSKKSHLQNPSLHSSYSLSMVRIGRAIGTTTTWLSNSRMPPMYSKSCIHNTTLFFFLITVQGMQNKDPMVSIIFG
jgi:hypothetical protein